MRCRHCRIEIFPSDEGYKREGIRWVHLRTRGSDYEVSCDPRKYYTYTDKIAEPEESYIVSQILKKYEM